MDRCTENDKGVFADVKFFQMGQVFIPTDVEERFLRQLTLKEDSEKEKLLQKAQVERKITSSQVSISKYNFYSRPLHHSPVIEKFTANFYQIKLALSLNMNCMVVLTGSENQEPGSRDKGGSPGPVKPHQNHIQCKLHGYY